MQESEKNLEFQEEINKVIRGYELKFDCPHCHEEINESHFGEREKAFQLIKEKVRKIAEEELNFQKTLYKNQWLKQIEDNKFYENFQGVIEKMKTIENLTKANEKLKEEKTEIEFKLRGDLAKATSYDEIRKLDGVKELEGKIDAYQKEIEKLKKGNQPEIQKLNQTIKELEENITKEKLATERAKSSEEVEKLDRVKNLKKEIEEKNKRIEELNTENQPIIKELRENIKKLEKEKADAEINLAKAMSADAVAESKMFKELKEECDKYKKENGEKEKELSELKSSEYVERLERVRKLVEETTELRNQNQTLRDQGRMSKRKGEKLEKYVLEKLQETYNGTDEISKITHLSEKADIIQEIYKDNQYLAKIIYEVKNDDKWKPKWLDKIEKDMVNERADYGIIVASCQAGKPLWKPSPQKNILVSDDENFIFASQIARILIFSKQRISQGDSAGERIKNWEEWIKEKLPNYLLRLEKKFTEWEADITKISTSVKNMGKAREEIRNIIISEMELELKRI